MWDSWHLPYRTLRKQFLNASQKKWQLTLGLTSFPDLAAHDQWFRLRVDREMARRADSTSQTSSAHLWGDTAAVNRFQKIATAAASALPPEFRSPVRLFPWFNPLANQLLPDAVTVWAEFLFVAQCWHFRIEEDWPAKGSRIALLKSDPFLTSVLAIEDSIFRWDDGGLDEFRQKIRIVCPWIEVGDAPAAATPTHGTAGAGTDIAALPPGSSAQRGSAGALVAPATDAGQPVQPQVQAMSDDSRAADALDTLKQRFLGFEGPVLSLQIDSQAPGVTFPDGLRPPIQGQMSHFSLNAPSDPIATNDASPPEHQALAEARESKSRLSGDRFVFPRSYLFSLFDPHDRETKRVTERFKRASDLRDRFLATARAAGQAVGSIPLNWLKWVDPRTPLSSRRPTEAAGLWAKVLFDLAWQKRPGLLAERLRVFVRTDRPGERFEVRYEDDAATLRRWLDETKRPLRFAETCRQILEHYGDTLPDFFTSTIEDIFSASALAAGMLADDLRRLANEDRRMTKTQNLNAHTVSVTVPTADDAPNRGTAEPTHPAWLHEPLDDGGWLPSDLLAAYNGAHRLVTAAHALYALVAQPNPPPDPERRLSPEARRKLLHSIWTHSRTDFGLATNAVRAVVDKLTPFGPFRGDGLSSSCGHQAAIDCYCRLFGRFNAVTTPDRWYGDSPRGGRLDEVGVAEQIEAARMAMGGESGPPVDAVLAAMRSEAAKAANQSGRQGPAVAQVTIKDLLTPDVADSRVAQSGSSGVTVAPASHVCQQVHFVKMDGSNESLPAVGLAAAIEPQETSPPSDLPGGPVIPVTPRDFAAAVATLRTLLAELDAKPPDRVRASEAFDSLQRSLGGRDRPSVQAAVLGNNRISDAAKSPLLRLFADYPDVIHVGLAAGERADPSLVVHFRALLVEVIQLLQPLSVAAGVTAGAGSDDELPASANPPAAPEAPAQRNEMGQKNAPAFRPEKPTAEYCLPTPGKIRWDGEADIPPRLGHLLRFILELPSHIESVPFAKVKADGFGRPSKGPKSVRNDISDLSGKLLLIKFPWTLGTKDSCLVIDRG